MLIRLTGHYSYDKMLREEHLQERIGGGEEVSPVPEEHRHRKGRTVRLKPLLRRAAVAVACVALTYATNELPGEFVPTWLPENYALVSLEALDNPYFTQVDAIFSDGGEYALTCSVCQYSGGVDAGSVQYEKSAENPERYSTNGMEFYLFENAGTWTGAWSDATYVITLGGLASREDLQRMIDTIHPAENTRRD